MTALTHLGGLLNIKINPPIVGRDELFRKNFWTFVEFLQEQSLTTRRIARSLEDMTDDFKIMSEDLTQRGLDFYWAAEDVWYGAIKHDNYEANLARVTDKTRFERVLARLEKKAAAKKAAKEAASKSTVMSVAAVKKRIAAGGGGEGEEEDGDSDDGEALAADLPSPYHVPDTWESFDKLKPVLDKRLDDWRRKTT
jgi:hypothetical protein